MSNKKKIIIELDIKEEKDLVELMNRGRAYTDLYYRPGKRMERIWDKVLYQIESQKKKNKIKDGKNNFFPFKSY